MTTAKKAAPTKATAKKAAARPNVKAAVPPQGDGIVDAPPPEKPEADPKPAKVMFTECPDCGYKFSKPQPTACRVKAACDKRKSDPDYRVKGATPKPTSDKPSQPGTRKASTISAMNTERQLEKDWKAGGEQGERPATPLLDKIRADFEAKEAKKAAAKAERDTAKVTPITKNSEAAAS